jgi:hypothetical protein
MNNFEKVKKIKWIIKSIKESLTQKGIAVKYASLLFEEDENKEVYEEIESRAEFNNFENLPLFMATFENDMIKLELIMYEDFNAASVVINDEVHGQNSDHNIDLREVIVQIKDNLTKESIQKFVTFY